MVSLLDREVRSFQELSFFNFLSVNTREYSSGITNTNIVTEGWSFQSNCNVTEVKTLLLRYFIEERKEQKLRRPVNMFEPQLVSLDKILNESKDEMFLLTLKGYTV